MLSYREFIKQANGSFFPGSTMPAPTTRPSGFAPGTTADQQRRQDAWNTGFREGAVDAAKVQGKTMWNWFDKGFGTMADLGAYIARKSVSNKALNPGMWLTDKIFGTHIEDTLHAGINHFRDAAKNQVSEWNNVVQNSDLYKDNLSDTDRTIAQVSTVPLQIAAETALLPNALTGANASVSVAKTTGGRAAQAVGAGFYGLDAYTHGKEATEPYKPKGKQIVQTATPEQRQQQAAQQQQSSQYKGVLSAGLAGVAGALGTNLFLSATPGLRKKRILKLWLSLAAGAGAGYLGWKYAQGKQ